MPRESDLWLYRADVLRWIDGDSVVLDVDLGLDSHRKLVVRVCGVDGRYFDAWETRGPERPQGLEARELAERLIPAGTERIFIRTHRDRKGKYGRYLARLYLPGTEDDFAERLVLEGMGEWLDD